ncbi:MAG: SagB/ThcOx family dehydrogenase [Candidatus Nitrosocosmicus sp.]
MNNDYTHALDYHEKTKHSQISTLYSRHYLDWENRPNPFKVYVDLKSILLPDSFPLPSMNAVKAIAAVNNNNINNKEGDIKFLDKDTAIDDSNYADINRIKSFRLTDLASILFFTCGITRHIKFNSTDYYMRAASATGALYPIEAYVVNGDINKNDLDAGVYHFNPGSFSLTAIRKGDYRKVLASYSANNSTTMHSPVSLVFTSNSWRNAWKYQSRSYRHWFWDCGVILANLLAVCKSFGLQTKLLMGFIDDEVNKLLGLEYHEEAAIIVASLYASSYLKRGVTNSKSTMGNGCEPTNEYGNEKSDGSIIQQVDNLKQKVYPLSLSKVFYPDIWKAYDTSKLQNNSQVVSWISKTNLIIDSSSKSNNSNIKKRVLKKYPIETNFIDLEIPTIGKVILKRGSSRRFSRGAVSLKTLCNILTSSMGVEGKGNLPMDYNLGQLGLVDLYFIANNIDGLQKGGYYFNATENTLDFLSDIPYADFSGHLCLDQPLFADASAVIFLMVDLKKILRVLGNRGYRVVQMESGIIAGKLYLLSYTFGIGASGSTFYDDEVTDFFSYHDGPKSTMIAIGIGTPPYQSKSGTVLPLRLTNEQMYAESKTL